MAKTVIQVDRLAKKFCKSLKKTMLYGTGDILQSALGATPDSSVLRNDEFWAVEDVHFQIEQGESFGIIGPNGSGKTTLLKMLNGIFMPDKGTIRIDGKIGALIQVGAGFHPMLSGRENIYINGAILGMRKAEIDRKFNEIVDFADIGDFLEAPVKHYSSGMHVRLGFAIAIHSQPDVLLIDEILAVGDKEFQIKCYQKMHEIKKSGVTIILVSHNEYVIREQTQRCLYLNHGRQRLIDSSEKVINVYIGEVYAHKASRKELKKETNTDADKKAAIHGLRFLDGNGQEVNAIESGDALTCVIDLKIKEKLNSPILGVNFYDEQGLVYAVNSYYENVKLTDLVLGDNTVKITLPQAHLPTNNYVCSVVICNESVSNLIDWHDCAYSLVVGRAQNARGLLKLPCEWTY